MNPLQRAATREINYWVEEFDGDWAKVRRAYLETVGLLVGYTGAAGYVATLQQVYEEMRPQ